MVTEAGGNGIDGFIVSWDGVHNDRFDLALRAAEAHPGFAIAPAISALNFRSERGFDVHAIAAAIMQTISRAGSRSFLRSSGKPVVFVYGARELGADAWNRVRADVSAAGFEAFYVGDDHRPAFSFEGGYLYNPYKHDAAELVRVYAASAKILRIPAYVNPAINQRLWVAPVSPGMNDTFTRPTSPHMRSRQGGARYDETWRAAVGSNPEWIVVTSWNEWYEATHVAPSERFGQLALDQTARWSGTFRGAAHPPASPERSGVLDLVPILP